MSDEETKPAPSQSKSASRAQQLEEALRAHVELYDQMFLGSEMLLGNPVHVAAKSALEGQ